MARGRKIQNHPWVESKAAEFPVPVRPYEEAAPNPWPVQPQNREQRPSHPQLKKSRQWPLLPASYPPRTVGPRLNSLIQITKTVSVRRNRACHRRPPRVLAIRHLAHESNQDSHVSHFLNVNYTTFLYSNTAAHRSRRVAGSYFCKDYAANFCCHSNFSSLNSIFHANLLRLIKLTLSAKPYRCNLG